MRRDLAGVDQSHVRWVKDDGVGRTTRNGLNFTERGFVQIRNAILASDRRPGIRRVALALIRGKATSVPTTTAR